MRLPPSSPAAAATRPRRRSSAPTRTPSSRCSTRASSWRESHSMSRYWMLETIREYAAEQLAESGDAVHAGSPSRLLPAAGRGGRAGAHRLGSGSLVRAARSRGGEPARSAGVRMRFGRRGTCADARGTIWRFWWSRGQVDEASRWYERAFAVGDHVSETARARGLFGAAHGRGARRRSDGPGAVFAAADALRAIGATRWLILALAHLVGTIDDPDQHRGSIRNLALAEESGDVRGAAIVKGNYAEHVLTLGDDQRAAELRQEALEGHRALGDVAWRGHESWKSCDGGAPWG